MSTFLGCGAHSSYDICFSLHLQRLGVGAGWVGVAWATGVVAEVGLLAVSGRLLAAAPPSRLLAIAFAGGALRWALLATVRSVPVLIALQPLHAISFSLFWVTSVELVRRRVPTELLATAHGVFNAAVGGGAVVGMFAWGATFESLGGPPTFACAAGVAVCAALAATGTASGPRPSGRAGVRPAAAAGRRPVGRRRRGLSRRTVHVCRGESRQGVLAGSTGSLPAACSSPSRKPSPSRSRPMRTPEPGGTQVYVISYRLLDARARRAASVSGGLATRSVAKVPFPTTGVAGHAACSAILGHGRLIPPAGVERRSKNSP